MSSYKCGLTSSSYALGIIFLLIVSLLWTICSMVVQHLYHDMQFDSPFLVVYIGTSLFSVFLPIRLFYERSGRLLKHRCCRRRDEHASDENEVIIIPWRNDLQLLNSSRQNAGFADTRGDSLNLMTSPSQQPNLNDNDDFDHNDDYSFDPTNGVQMKSNEFANEEFRSETYNSHHYDPVPENFASDSKYLLSHQDHISMATKIAPLWFLSNYFYAISLEWTTISSSTVLASMGSLFAFAFATCSKYGDEKVTRAKALGVLLCFMGGVATTWTDISKSTNPNLTLNSEALGDSRYLWQRFPHLPSNTSNPSMISLWGDLAGLVSAIGYGAYTVLLRHLCPKDENRMSMQLFFGYVGLLNMTILLPIALWAILSSNDDVPVQNQPDSNDYEDHSESKSISDKEFSSSSAMTWSIFLFLVLKGLLDNVLSDYLWARAVILTSATVASVSVGLTIPMAFAADILMGNDDSHGKGDILGAVLVLIGFVFVNIDGAARQNETQEEDDGELEFDHNCGVDTGGVRDMEILS